MPFSKPAARRSSLCACARHSLEQYKRLRHPFDAVGPQKAARGNRPNEASALSISGGLARNSAPSSCLQQLLLRDCVLLAVCPLPVALSSYLLTSLLYGSPTRRREQREQDEPASRRSRLRSPGDEVHEASTAVAGVVSSVAWVLRGWFRLLGLSLLLLCLSRPFSSQGNSR